MISYVDISVDAAVVVGDDIGFCESILVVGNVWYSTGKREAYRGSNRGRHGDGIIITCLLGAIIRFVDVVANCGVDAVEE